MHLTNTLTAVIAMTLFAASVQEGFAGPREHSDSGSSDRAVTYEEILYEAEMAGFTPEEAAALAVHALGSTAHRSLGGQEGSEFYDHKITQLFYVSMYDHFYTQP